LEARVQHPQSDYLVVALDAINNSSASAELETGHCPYRVRAYPSADLTEPAFWDDHPANPNTGCYAEGLVYFLPPVSTTRLRTDTLYAADLAMGIPSRAGYFGVIVSRDEQRVILPAGTIPP
jgi:hypothetical protein